MSSLKVLIAGAGIGGPAAAFWLSRIGCDVTVVERNPTLRATGQQVDLSGQGIVITRMMGIEDALRAARCPEPGMRFVDYQGKTKAFFPVDTSGKAAYSPTHEIEVMRGDLVNILYDATKNLGGVKYLFDSHVKHFTQDEGSSGGKVHVTLSDGTRDDFDILIGADGIASATRKLLLGTSFPDLHRDLGVYMAYFTAPSREDDTFDWSVCHIPGGKAIMTRRDKPENIRVYLATRVGFAALDAAKTLADQKTALVDLFKGTQGWQLDRFLNDLENSSEADDLYCQRMSQIRLPEGGWSKGRVVLLGDAAFCPGAIGGGVGTTAALIGAYVLAGEIEKQWKKNGQTSDKFNAEEAAKEYERVLRPFITSKSEMSTWMVRLWLPESNFGVKTLQAIAGYAAGAQISKYSGKSQKPDESRKLEYPDYFGLKPGL
ncbi:FAD/NAD(P)-binding domain-containing protein [Dothidotthia symphoricarpi CBS 119687]|uniref:FAD/NAD(P)-binding domain-containing protein n=1 Tax=Dothidotthia symphoricarpi CBS 119687 TaxID=1392245 RepID=A0A6A6AUW4_9PLEO|nr:FAD/NAD(P)-binding domain-containing protein [Dothidotthia symphoricarpi CBS 119687]KAF2134734.1 FAD/NAD(P)-binding domain-containing protein [Dothidotthia symphoricarpi CBS 119687]